MTNTKDKADPLNKATRSSNPRSNRQKNKSNAPSKPRRSKGQKYRKNIKKDPTATATAKIKEDNHKKHPKVDYINKAINARVRELETLCRPKLELLKGSGIDILKQKKVTSLHKDTLQKLLSPNFAPKSIKKKLEITTSTRTMETEEFKSIAERSKLRQEKH